MNGYARFDDYVRNTPRSRIFLMVALIVCLGLFIFRPTNSGESKLKLSAKHNTTEQGPPDLSVPRTVIMASERQEPIAGGLGGTRQADDEVVRVVESVKPELEQKTGLKFDSIEPINYKHQVVAGMNFFVKAKAKVTDGDTKIIHLRIYRNLKQDVTLTAYQMDKSEQDELTYFQ